VVHAVIAWAVGCQSVTVSAFKARCGNHPHRFDVSSERTFGLSGFCTLRILARRNRKLPDFRHLIAQRYQFAVLARLPLLHIVERFPSGDDDTLGRVTGKARDFTTTHDEAATAVLNGLDRCRCEFLFVFILSAR
jgi:hypothetical protein